MIQIIVLLVLVGPGKVLTLFLVLMMLIATCMDHLKRHRHHNSLLNTPGHKHKTNAEMIQPQRMELILRMEVNIKEWFQALMLANYCVMKEELSAEL